MVRLHPVLIYPVLWGALVLGSGCHLDPPEGTLVPATVTEDPRLPSITVTVEGRSRRLHVRTYGDPGAPVFLILPGSLSDLRAYLPFQAFADRYRVVLWDAGGNGLSQRLDRADLGPDRMVEEIQAVKQRFSPDRPVTLLGHSWSANFAALYVARHPSEVSQLILMEPFGLRDRFMDDVGGIVNLTRVGYLDMAWSASQVGPHDHALLDFRMLGMLTAAVRNFFLDPDHPPPWPVWRVGGLALITWESSLIGADGTYRYDYTPGLGNFPGPVLLVGSSASPIGYQFQEKRHLGLFAHGQSLRIGPSGHRMITEQWEALAGGIRAFLALYH